MTRQACRLITCLMTMACLLHPCWGQEGQAKALLIGTQDFVSPSFGSLAGIGADLELMKTTLTQSCGIPASNVTTVLSTRSNVVSKASMVTTLENFFQSAGPNDALVIYLTSHGVVYEGEYQIAVTETRLSNEQIKQTSISAGQLRKWSEKSKAKTVLVILDTCQSLLSQQLAAELAAQGKAMSNTASSGFTSQVAAKFLGNPSAGGGVRAILYSCRPSEQSYMDTNYLTGTNNSYFTLALCEGLQGKAAAPNGEVSLKSLNDFTSRRLSELIEADRQHRLAKGASPDQLPNQQSSNMEVLGGQPTTFVLATVKSTAGSVASAGNPYAPPAQTMTPAGTNPQGYNAPPGYAAQPPAPYPTATQPAPLYSPQAQPAPPYAAQTQPAPLYPAQIQPAPLYPVQTQPAPLYPVTAQPAPVYQAQPQQAPVYQAQTQAAPYYTSQPGVGHPAQPVYPVVPSMTSQPVQPSNPAQGGYQPTQNYSPTAPTVASVHPQQPTSVVAVAQPAMAPNNSPQQTEISKVSGGILEVYPSSEFMLAAADIPVAAKGLSRDRKAASAVNGTDFALSLRCDRGESDANLRVTVQSAPSSPASDVYLRVMASPDRQTWFPIRDWSFRLPGGYRVSRDYVGADPQLFNHQVFYVRAELMLPSNAVVVREARFTATPSR